jgi:type II secretory pathway pseudopilin PulG
VLVVTVVLVVGVVLLIAGSVQASFVLIALSVACAATAGVVGVLSARQRRARAERALVQLGSARLRALAALRVDGPGAPPPPAHAPLPSVDRAGPDGATPAEADQPARTPAETGPEVAARDAPGGGHRPQAGASGDDPDPPPEESPSRRPSE